ncbi:hypothetical protein AK88_04166 [Plasmodium fragile]|uniref:Uncharacterized protein n=1 Tax=Plasmodium fragile TaxID=5857 RepID=A0A0D9QGL6_PLAFR|nr:uncharacterized protein AK88_04166 [Plasmodium fragile]KJP86195.1 hypothetical protein AK88_04166 [Plasmodium fragile]
MAPPTFMTQGKYIQLLSLAKKLHACKNELLRYKRGETSATAATCITPMGGSHTGLSIATQSNPTKMERRLPKGEFYTTSEKRNSIKSVSSEPTLRTTKRSATPQPGRKKRQSDPTPLRTSFTKERIANAHKIKDEYELHIGQLAKGTTRGEYKAKKKKKKKLKSKTQVLPHNKGTQKSRKKKKKTFCTLPKHEVSKRITNIARCSKKWVLHKQEENAEYTFRSPHGAPHLTAWEGARNSGENEIVPVRVETKLQMSPLLHTSQVMEDPPVIASMRNNSSRKNNSTALSTQRGKQPRTKPSKSEKTSSEGTHPAHATNKRHNESAPKKEGPFSKGAQISRRITKRKRQNVTRKTAPKRSILHAPPTQQRGHDYQEGEKQSANQKTVKEFIKALNNSSVIICTKGHKTRPKRSRRKCLHTKV